MEASQHRRRPSVMRSRQQLQALANRRRRSRSAANSSTHHVVYTLSPRLADVVEHWCWWSRACWDFCGSLVTIPIFSEESLLRVSFVLVTCHHMSVFLDQVFPDNHDSGESATGGDNDEAQQQPFLTNVFWIWCAPIVLSCIVGLVVSWPYWFQFSQGGHYGEQTMVMITALVALFFLEALLPVMIFLSSALLLLRQVDWLTGLAVIGSVWSFLTFLTHFVRCAVYQNLGGH